MPISELLAILGNAGEFIGSLVVLVTLIYLSIQTRNINRQSQAEARYAFVESMAEINMCIAHSKQASSVWRQHIKDRGRADFLGERRQNSVQSGFCGPDKNGVRHG